jgi:hypothetical protein
MNVLNEMKYLKLGIPEHTAELLRPGLAFTVFLLIIFSSVINKFSLIVMEKTEQSGKLLDEMVKLYKVCFKYVFFLKRIEKMILMKNFINLGSNNPPFQGSC